MRVIVRILLRLLVLGSAAAALVVLASRAEDAQADTTAPPGDAAAGLASAVARQSPATPLAPPPAPPAPPVVASVQQSPPATPLLPPAPPTVPDPSRGVPLPQPSGLLPDAPPGPASPAPPDVSGVDPSQIADTVGAVPGVPSVSLPDPLGLPPLPALPELPTPLFPTPASPFSVPTKIGVAPDASASTAGPPSPAPTAITIEQPGSSGPAPADGGGSFNDFGNRSAPARAPPPTSPLQPCPVDGASKTDRADAASLAPPGVDDAMPRVNLLLDARSCSSAFVRDPLLRPD